MKKFVLYCRTSTKRQNLSLIAQQEYATNYAKSINATIIAVYFEQESAKLDNRPKLAEAIQHCKDHNAQLLIAKLDRLSRNVAFLFKLKEELEQAKVSIVVADCPDLLNNTLSLAVMSGLAQYERELISNRIKQALEVVKKSKHIGRQANCDLSKQQKLAVESIKKRADEFARIHQPIIKVLYEQNISLTKIASILNQENRKTSRGTSWNATTVRRVLHRKV